MRFVGEDGMGQWDLLESVIGVKWVQVAVAFSKYLFTNLRND